MDVRKRLSWICFNFVLILLSVTFCCADQKTSSKAAITRNKNLITLEASGNNKQDAKIDKKVLSGEVLSAEAKKAHLKKLKRRKRRKKRKRRAVCIGTGVGVFVLGCFAGILGVAAILGGVILLA